MSATITDECLQSVRQWAAAGVDLNGIQKRLQTECGVHLTYMEVRFLLLDHGIEIAEAKPEAPQQPTAGSSSDAPAEAKPAQEGKVKVTLDDLQLPGTLVSGKVDFPGGAHGEWQIDQLGQFGWRALSGQPSPDEMQGFQLELTQLLSRM